jgi:hypothetical protein
MQCYLEHTRVRRRKVSSTLGVHLSMDVIRLGSVEPGIRDPGPFSVLRADHSAIKWSERRSENELVGSVAGNETRAQALGDVLFRENGAAHLPAVLGV